MTTEEKKLLFERMKSLSSMLLIAFTLGITSYYILFPSRGYFHSDSTDTIMWAEASYEAKALFNANFAYACLLPFGTSLIMTALIPFTGVSMTTHVVGMLIFFLLFAGGLVLLLRKMGWNQNWISIALFVEIMICSGSGKLREIYWGHTIYYSLGVLFIFVGLALIFMQMDYSRELQATEDETKEKIFRKKLLFCTIGIGIWFMLTGMDQISAITIFAIPVIGAIFCVRWFDNETEILSFRNFQSFVLILIMIVGTVAGYFLTKVLANGIVAGYEEAYSQYSDMAYWMDNLRKFPTAWLSLLGVSVQANTPLMSAESVCELIKIILGILLLILPVFALLNWKNIQDEKEKIIILTYWLMTLLIMMGYVMGKLSEANWRLSPIVGMSTLVSVIFLKWSFKQIHWKRISCLFMIPVLFVSGSNAFTMAEMPADNTSQNGLYFLEKKLAENHLTYGYATFWNANAITIISDSEIKCRSIEIDESGIWQRPYQSNWDWYKDQPEQENYFLLLSGAEVETLTNINDPLLSYPHEEISAGTYKIWVFDENLF